MTSFIGALIGTFFLSRLLLRVLPSMPQVPRVLVAHAVSFALFALLVGLTKAYYTSFALHRTLVLVVPQLIWLSLDLARHRVAPSFTRR